MKKTSLTPSANLNRDVFLCDVIQGAILAEKIQVKASTSLTSSPVPFRLPGAIPPTGGKTRAALIPEELGLSRLRNSVVVIGCNEDPFEPFDVKFHLTAALLSYLADSEVAQVIINTRSPLVLLAMPALRVLGERVTVCFALEALSDAIHELYFHHTPRPSERIRAAHTLRELGVAVSLQLAPVVGKIAQQSMPRELAALLMKGLSAVKVCTVAQVFAGRQSLPKRNGKSFPVREFSARAMVFYRTLRDFVPEQMTVTLHATSSSEALSRVA